MLDLFARYATFINANGEAELLCAPAIEADIYTSFLLFDPWPDLVRAPQPKLLIHGTGPSVMASVRVDEVLPALQNTRLVELPDGGHLILMEAPQKIAEAIKAFLRETE